MILNGCRSVLVGCIIILLSNHFWGAKVVVAFGPLSFTKVSHRTALKNNAVESSSTTDCCYDKVCECIGSGSYGTVHILESSTDGKRVVGKRSWNLEDHNMDDNDRISRCNYYWEVEQHFFQQKLPSSKFVPKYLGTQDEWMLFELLLSNNNNNNKNNNDPQPAKSLADIISEEWIEQHQSHDSNHHHLYLIQQQLGLTTNDDDDGEDGFALTLDTIITSILNILVDIHNQKIVHRDIKPSNLLLLPNKQMILIDFGSAADMEPISTNFGWSKRYVGLEDPTRVAVSPNYVAPETYIQPSDKDDAFKFDVYSAALIICQLILNYLDEVTDAGFNQQFSIEAKNDLDVWLSRCELSKKVRPDGLEDALQYLASRPGLWNLLKQMLQVSPNQRLSSQQALKRWNTILSYAQSTTTTIDQYEEPWMDDGKFFNAVLQNFEQCEIPLDEDDEMTLPRALHYVATFERKMSLGLILSEVDTVTDDDDDEMDEVSLQKWNEATKNAQAGEVYVRRIVPMGQADLMGKGIIDVGDQVQGVGELPLLRGGFSRVLELLEDQPSRERFVRLHFDRSSSLQKRQQQTVQQNEKRRPSRRAVQQGAWSVVGKRKAQEDAVVLHEIHDGDNHNIVLAGVFDGHGGKAASQTASQLMPSLVTAEITTSTLKEAIERAWETTCMSYRKGCDELGEQCVADYDPREGILLASTGSKDMTAGTTASMSIFDEDELIVLNCGDSRTLLVGPPANNDNDDNNGSESAILFATRDHSPFCKREQDRLQRGRDELGLDYSIPECSMSRWSLKVGDYRYALSRSLEGTFATSKGIVSDADISDLSSLAPSMIVTASDGLFEVMDNEEVAQDLLRMRYERNMSASDAAKNICEMALDKGTSDNVSVVIVYLEES